MILHKGKVLKMTTKESFVIVALLERASVNGWNALVIGGNNSSYKPGGFDIFVFDSDLENAIEVILCPAPL